ncbi:MAG: hypothetical protein RAP70_07895 [Candidatus Celaenobacter antarcticus]|nr:hypothetical protein [Candidatus Celaenobacter antarcticus]MDP8314978.1 hypothetical protein [Candidatus Celaenobacter antarcticus]
MAKKKETVEKYLYDAKKFCVPVTKIGSLESIQFVIDDFVEKKVTFCVDGSDDRWEVWRIEEEGDSDKIKKKDFPRKPKFLYINGGKLDYVLKK